LDEKVKAKSESRIVKKVWVKIKARMTPVPKFPGYRKWYSFLEYIWKSPRYIPESGRESDCENAVQNQRVEVFVLKRIFQMFSCDYCTLRIRHFISPMIEIKIDISDMRFKL
jgi:hypothetical protein